MATHKIVAADSAKPATTKAAKAPKPTAVKAIKAKKVKKEGRRNIFVQIGGYFKGAWFELREVRWPNRKATWSLTLAVLAFVIFFTLLITGLDALYKYLFELILK